MAYERRPGAPWRRKSHDGTAPGRDALDGQVPVPRSLSVTFHPMTQTTLATVVVRDFRGHDRWDRTDGTLIVELPAAALAGQDIPTALRLLLRSALEALG